MAISDLDERTDTDVYLLARQIHADFAGGKLVSDVDDPMHVAPSHDENEDI